MMNDNDDDIDLGLALGSSNQRIRTRVDHNTGAGVNAGAGLDMTFAASDPLSELVWSPHKGLSLKFAECSSVNKRPFLLWHEMNNMVLAPSQDIRSKEGTDIDFDERNVMVSQATAQEDKEANRESSLQFAKSSSRSSSPVIGSTNDQRIGIHSSIKDLQMPSDCCLEENSNDIDKLKTEEGVQVMHSDQYETARFGKEKDPCIAHDIQIARIPESNEEREGGGGFAKGLASEMHDAAPKYLSVSQLKSPLLNERGKAELLAVEPGTGCKQRMHSTSEQPMDKLESTAENDLQCPCQEEAYAQNKERLARGKSVPLITSPLDSRICVPSKGKEKAVSDGNIGGQVSDNEEDSHESVESCNSGGLFAIGKKRCNSEEHLRLGSKRTKTENQGNASLTSVLRHNSSFMNWISNMVKGFSRCDQEGAPSLALTLTHPNPGQDNNHQEIIMCDKDSTFGYNKVGFHSMFQSLYRPNTGMSRLQVLEGDQLVREGNELVITDASKKIPANTCCLEDDKFCENKFLLDTYKPSTPRNVTGTSTQVPDADVAPSREDSKAVSTGSKVPVYQFNDKSQGGPYAADPLHRRKSSNSDNYSPTTQSERRATPCSNSDHPHANLWITRFSAKSPKKVSDSHSYQDRSGARECLAGSTRRGPPQISSGVLFDRKSSEGTDYSIEDQHNASGKDLRSFASNGETSVDFKDVQGHQSQKSILDVVPHSQTLTNSEAMASLFAKRLDALKRNIPPESKDDAARACLFCGRIDHDIRDCSEVSETEIELILKNISSYHCAEESTCVCVRCFQDGHWAITCPVRSARLMQQKNRCDELVECCNQMQSDTGHDQDPSSLVADKDGDKVNADHIILDKEKDKSDMGFSLRSLIQTESPTKQKIPISEEVQKLNRGKDFLGKQTLNSFNFVNKQIAHIPTGIIDAVKRLRLSRMDILKWQTSHLSLSHLRGFFLRLRLGNWDSGLGGTGYYVACITAGASSGTQNERPTKDPKISLSVDIGGIKCLVGSQYVSNHDFLEDELIAWWTKTLGSGDKIPSEDDLRLKLEERIMLGF